MSAKPATAGRVALACLAALVVTQTAPRARAQSYARPAPALTAAVEVRLPAGAELWFDGVATTPAGDRRTFTTPPLQAGRTYGYEVQARWREGGRDVVRGERVIVRAGEAVVVDFTLPREDEHSPDHMAVRDVARPGTAARVVPAAHDSLVDLPAGPPPARRLPGHMAVVEFDPTTGAVAAERPAPAVPRHMSIVEFDTPRRQASGRGW